jgi:enamine deaminase RidA (YjgF/YER057c/UK114 family)
MPRQLIGSDCLTDAVPYHYATAVTAVTGVRLVFSAGASPLDADGRVVAAGDILGQTRQSVERLRVALEDTDCTRADVVKTTIYVASPSRDDLLLAWNEYESAYGTDGPPSTLLGRSARPGPSSSSPLRPLRSATGPSRCAPRLLPQSRIRGLTRDLPPAAQAAAPDGLQACTLRQSAA